MSRPVAQLISELQQALVHDDKANIWGHAGERALDRSVALVADHYIQQAADRSVIREEIRKFPSRWGLVLYVRRVGLLINAQADRGELWLKRGLAAASLVDAHCDDRDLIVSLVLLRSFALKAGLPTDRAFDQAIGWSTGRMTGILTNARNHSLKDIDYTVEAFGPAPQVLAELDQQPQDCSGETTAS